MSEREQLERAVAVLEAQRAVLGDEVVETVLASLREKLASLERADPQDSPQRAGAGGTTALSPAHQPAPTEEAFTKQHKFALEAANLAGLGKRALYLGDYPTARHYLEQALTISREIGDRQGESVSLVSLGKLETLTGNYRRAESYCREALRIASEVEDPSAQGYALTFLGQSLFGQGQLEEARAAYQAALEIRQSRQQSGLALDDLAGLALVELARGEAAEAQIHAQEILDHLLQSLEAGPEETATVYLALYQVLLAARDPRAQAVLESGYAWIQERASQIKDESSRLSFLENIPAHRLLAAAWEMSNLEE